MMMRRSAIAQRSGAALMLALWALFLLSAMVIAWALDIDSRLTLSGNASRVVEAEAMAAARSGTCSANWNSVTSASTEGGIASRPVDS